MNALVGVCRPVLLLGCVLHALRNRIALGMDMGATTGLTHCLRGGVSRIGRAIYAWWLGGLGGVLAGTPHLLPHGSLRLDHQVHRQ